MKNKKQSSSRENKRYVKELIIMSLILALVGITISYAAVNTTLDIVGFTSAKVATWNVGFSSTRVSSKTGNAQIIRDPRTDGLNIFYEIALDEPGDSVTIEAIVKNNGNLDAKLISYNLSGIPTKYEDNISYKVTDKNGNPLEINTVLSGGRANEVDKTMPVYITITYENYIYEGEGVKTFNLGLGLNFMQDCAKCKKNLS